MSTIGVDEIGALLRAERRTIHRNEVELHPFDPQMAYCAYRVNERDEPECIAGTPTLGGIGLMLDTLEDDGEFGTSAIGVLDTTPRQEGKRARWLINPYAGRRVR